MSHFDKMCKGGGGFDQFAPLCSVTIKSGRYEELINEKQLFYSYDFGTS